MQGNKSSNIMADLESALDNKHTPAPAPTSGPRVYNNRPQVNRPPMGPRVTPPQGAQTRQMPVQHLQVKHGPPPYQSGGCNLPKTPYRPQVSNRFGGQPQTPYQPPRLKVLMPIGIDRIKTKRENDFMFVELDEYLFCPEVPHGGFADDEEGLSRSFVGTRTGNRTTVAQVREVAGMTASDLQRKIEQFLLKELPDQAINYKKKAKTICDRTLAVVSKHRINEVIEYRDGRDSVR